MVTPFSLEKLASKVDYSKQRVIQDYFDKKAKKATALLEKELDRLYKKAKEKSKGFLGGVLDKFGVDLPSRLEGALETGLGIVSPAARLALHAVDTVKEQKDLSERIKSLGKDIRIPAQYKGTFMEDYLRRGFASGSAGAKRYVEGAKSANLMSSLFELGLIATPMLKGAGEAASKAAGKEAAKKTFTEILESPTKKTVADVAKDFAGSRPNIAGKLGSLIGGFGKGTGVSIGDLTEPLMEGTPMMERFATPSSYAPLLKLLLDDYLKGPTQEPIMTELKAPKVY